MKTYTVTTVIEVDAMSADDAEEILHDAVGMGFRHPPLAGHPWAIKSMEADRSIGDCDDPA